MDKNAIKKYAVWARTELIDRVRQRAVRYEVTSDANPNADSASGKVLTDIEKTQRQAAIARMRDKGYEYVIEEVAYTWFNRFAALRYMEVNNYLPSRVRVFTDENGSFKPQILTEAIHLNLDGLDMEKVYALKEAENSDELYKYLLITQCNALGAVLPQMFKPVDKKFQKEKDDYTILLFPDNLLREESALAQMIEIIPENNWKDAVQVIGWLYQYYNIEPKAEVDSKVKKGIKVSKNELPAKTQIFTPDWVVRYMVENSVGRLWLEGHPDDTLKSGWAYYLDEAEQEEGVQTRLSECKNRCISLKPTDILCIDPCMGSGHILAYLFDTLMKIYADYGYSTRESVECIIEHNLYGLDIDDRATQLAYFSVMMKAVQYDGRFLKRSSIPQPHIHSIHESDSLDQYAIEYFCNDDAEIKKAIHTLVVEMKNAKEYGSLTHISRTDFSKLFARLEEVKTEIHMMKDYVLTDLSDFISSAYLLYQKYDVVITNPPYLGGGGMSDELAEFAKTNYPLSKNDMFAMFIECGNRLAKPGMINCMVTMQSWMFLSSYEKMRNSILESTTIANLMHMDNQVMGIAFGTAVTILKTEYIPNYKGTYNYVFNSDIVEDVPFEFPVQKNRFSQVSASFYEDIPGSPIAYWISETTRNAFMAKDTIGTVSPPKQGLATADNNRFLRLWFEVTTPNIGFGVHSCEEAEQTGLKWFPYNKGGAFRRWYGNRDYVVNWENDGIEIKNFKDDKGKVRSRPQNLQYYFKPAITWSDVTSGSFSGRYVEDGFMFDIKGSSGFPQVEMLPYVLGLLNSKVAQAFIKILNPTMTTQVGDMTRIPVLINAEYEKSIIQCTNECIAAAKADWNSFETAWEFRHHPLIGNFSIIEDAFTAWEKECHLRFNTLKANEEQLNAMFIKIYGLEKELDATVDTKYVTVSIADLQRDIKSLISYAVGCMFGRYSLDADGLAFAGGEWDASKYVSYPADKDNIIPICDDDYFEDDITGLFIKFIETVYGKDTLDLNLRYIADALGGKGTPKEVIREYFLSDKGFYADHCSMYSVTGSGKRPIYWLFDSGKKNGFKALVYMHRYQPDTIARMRTDYVHEQQSRYRTAIADLENRIAGASTSERVRLTKQLSKLQDQSAEIHTYEEKIHHLADRMIAIDLDDGVKHNYEIFKGVLAKIK